MGCAEALLEEGLIARRMPGFEVRPQQLEMVEEVARAFDQREHLLVEAGTGVVGQRRHGDLVADLDRINRGVTHEIPRTGLDTAKEKVAEIVDDSGRRGSPALVR